MNEEERDIVEFTDDEGNSVLLEVLDCFFYNGEEFAVLSDAEDCDCHDEECDCGGDEEGCGHEHSLYIMKIETSVDENGEEMEEFIAVEDSLMEALIEVVQTRFFDEDDEDAEFVEAEDTESE